MGRFTGLLILSLCAGAGAFAATPMFRPSALSGDGDRRGFAAGLPIVQLDRSVQDHAVQDHAVQDHAMPLRRGRDVRPSGGPRSREYIIRFKGHGGLSASSVLQSVLQKSGAGGTFRKLGDGRFGLVRLAPGGDEKEFRRAAALDPTIAYVEPNSPIHALEFPTDPGMERAWHLRNLGDAGSTGQEGVPGADIHVRELWERGFVGGAGMLVAVIDTGIDWNHPDLAANVVTLKDGTHGWNFISHTPDAMDDNGHGTHVAGIIGALANNGQGAAGIAWNVKLLPLKILDDKGSGDTASAIEAIAFARALGARILNNSWGGDPYSQALRDAIEDAGRAGVLFVAAAGNDGSDNDEEPMYPASYDLPGVLSVAASDNRDNRAEFSNYGARSVHVAAPGLMIYSTFKGGYEALSGTSMATPQVAGIAALVWSCHPELTLAELRERIIRSCDPSYSLKRRVACHGRVNAWNAFYGIHPQQGPEESEWRPVARRIESAHPYASGEEQVWVVTVPGAKYVRVHFERIDTEEFDRIIIESPAGDILETLSGEIRDYASEPVRGDTLRIRFRPDLSLEKWGFVADRVEWVPSPSE